MDYVGQPFQMGTTDCYGLMRDYYAQEFGIILPNFARPDDFWLYDMDLYLPRYRKLGFEVLNGAPRHGDIILMAVASTHANHCAIVMDDGQILHHMYGRLSTIEPYKSLWRNLTVGIFRHPDVPAPSQSSGTLDLLDILSPSKRKRINDLLDAAREV